MKPLEVFNEETVQSWRTEGRLIIQNPDGTVLIKKNRLPDVVTGFSNRFTGPVLLFDSKMRVISHPTSSVESQNLVLSAMDFTEGAWRAIMQILAEENSNL